MELPLPQISPQQLRQIAQTTRLNEGTLGRKRREGEFTQLTDAEVTSIEAIVRQAFDGYEGE
jgi:hypothetical protein